MNRTPLNKREPFEAPDAVKIHGRAADHVLAERIATGDRRRK